MATRRDAGGALLHFAAMSHGVHKNEFDPDAYERRVREGPCFICAFVTGNPDYQHHTVYEDDETIAFLNR